MIALLAGSTVSLVTPGGTATVTQFVAGSTGSLLREPVGLLAVSSSLELVTQRQDNDKLFVLVAGDQRSALTGQSIAFDGDAFAFDDATDTYPAVGGTTQYEWTGVTTFPLAPDVTSVVTVG